MPADYQSAVARLMQLGHELHLLPSSKFELGHMRTLLAALGEPQMRFRAVLIAGTNGKGSTAATLASILRAAGYRTGLYTSPHLVRVNERIKVQGEDISDAAFAEAHERVEAAAQRLVEEGGLPWHPSFFEMLTAMAFDHFARGGVEVAVLEVGMGGRLDATNVVEPVLAIVTDIALDHQKFLGNTIGEIAREKAGIIRPGGVVVTLPQHPEANDVLGNTMLERGARAVSAVQYVPPVSPGAGEYFAKEEPRTRYPLPVLGREINVDSPLLGRHQLRNIALAVAAAVELNALGVPVSAEQIERGIRETRWPARFQVVRWALDTGHWELILDVAHNPAGAWALRAALSQYAGERPITLVFGAMRDKAIAEMAEVLFPLAAHVVTTRAANPRSATPEEVRDAGVRTSADVRPAASVAEALEIARSRTPPAGLIVVTGSIYIVGEALAAIGSAGAER